MSLGEIMVPIDSWEECIMFMSIFHQLITTRCVLIYLLNYLLNVEAYLIRQLDAELLCFSPGVYSFEFFYFFRCDYGFIF